MLKEINMRVLKTILLFIPYTVYLLFCKLFRKEKKASWYNDFHQNKGDPADTVAGAGSGSQADHAICSTMIHKHSL